MNITQRGPLGQKQPKPQKPARRRIPPISKRRKAQIITPEYAAGVAHMKRVKEQMGCMVCGIWPAELHHATRPRDHRKVLPLCPQHHRREFGAGAYHYSPRAFLAAHGEIETLLATVEAAIYGSNNDR